MFNIAITTTATTPTTTITPITVTNIGTLLIPLPQFISFFAC
jgi:hypothetical protein